MKKVLIISASPRKGGNSDTLCDEFAKGAIESGNSVEKIFLKNKNIRFCTGCGYCNTVDYPACSQKDDMAEILDKAVAADVIVMATPVYFYTMNAIMKNFIDRCCSRYTKITNKEFYFIATAADVREQMLQRTFDGFEGFLDCLDGAIEKARIYGVGVWGKDEIEKTKFIQQAYDLGKNV